MTSGPNAAPNPAQAFATSAMTPASGSSAKKNANTATAKTEMRLNQTKCRSEAFLLISAL